MPDGDNNLNITFDEILSRAQVENRRDPSIIEEAKALASASYFDEKTNVVEQARGKLMKENPQKLYLDCLKDLISEMNAAPKSEKFIWAASINYLALQGLGIKVDWLSINSNDIQDVVLSAPQWGIIEKHIKETVLGDHFLYKISVPTDSELWGEEFPLRISACDASQHRFKLATPFNANFSSPVVVNNAAGIIKTEIKDKDNQKQWTNITVPKNTNDFENWVIVGYKDFTELDDHDYEWATKSAMDVGEFYVEENWIFQSRGIRYKPDIHFRDGRIFPQDHAENCSLMNRHGELSREAILRMNSAVKKAKELDIIYCGAAKRTQLKLWSIVIDWYITKRMGEAKWNVTRHILSDSEVMKRFIYTENFEAASFKEIMVTAPVLHSYYTTSNFNRRTDAQFQNDLNRLKKIKHNRNLSAADIVKDALDLKVAMFFAGHTKTTELYLPRYEFIAHDSNQKKIDESIVKVLSGLRLASFDVDVEHMWGLDTPIPTLLPTPLILADKLSREMGKELSRDWKAKVLQEFKKIRQSATQ
jgi:hypothetical protein